MASETTVRVAVQGFLPFRDFTENPSEHIVHALASQPPAGIELHTRVLPVEREAVSVGVPEFFNEVLPDVWIGVGLWDGRPSVSVERFAANLADFFTPDMAGAQPRNELIDEQGPAARRSTIPDGAIVEAWTASGIPGFASNTAGAFLCNMSLYLAGAANEKAGGGTLVGFIHVPLLPGMVRDARSEPSVALGDLVRAVEVAIDVCARHVRESRAAAV